MSADDYVSVESTPLYKQATGSGAYYHLLWGDGVEVIQPGAQRTKVRARSRTLRGYVKNEALGGQPLLEVYFIDVGQGDGVLVRTPDGRHLMIDGGYPRRAQNTFKSAADFIDWKFYEDYAASQIKLDAMLASHCDYDHYGGLWDLLDVSQDNELDASSVRVKAFYHAGVAWWKKPGGGRWLGTTTQDGPDSYLVQLMGNRSQVLSSLGGGQSPQLQGQWAKFLQTVTGARWTDGQPTTITRLSHANSYLPGFEPGPAGRPSVRILGPVEFTLGGQPAIHHFTGGNSQNTNGNSLLLRLDYGRARILLTGDLNRKSQRALLEDYTGERQEFQCDVAKACHHGSEDVSYEFLQAMQPAVTVISSGDNEGHDHPRAPIVAASGATGYLDIHDDRIRSPLVYSTELARSVSFGRPFKLEERDSTGSTTATLEGAALKRARIHFEEQKPGGLNPKKKSRSMKSTSVVAGLIYGLVNVRTDGDRILCATMKENSGGWNIQTVRSRF